MPINRPTAKELTPILTDFFQGITRKITSDEKLSHEEGFNLRIANKLLGIVDRELSAEEELNKIDRGIVQDLLGDKSKDFSDLVAKIDEGQFDSQEQMALLIDKLFETTLIKLSVDNPKYSSYQNLLQTTSKT